MTPVVAPAPSLPTSARVTRILLAATAREVGMFLGEHPALAETQLFHRDTEAITPEKWKDTLEESRPEILISSWSTPLLPLGWLSEPDNPLRYVCHLTGSVRGVVPRTFIKKGGLVTNWGNCAAPQVAEHALLLILTALRDATRWKTFHPTTKLQTTRTLIGKRVGIHGFGKIARRCLAIMKPFDVKVQVYAPGVPEEFIRAHDAEPCISLLELAKKCEVFLDCEALTEDSRSSVSREVLAALPDDAVFVNVGRGQVIDESALLEEALSKRLRVAVDVVAKEPVPPDSPWVTQPNLIYSPHIAGPTGDTLRLCGEHALENIQRYLKAENLESRVSLETYDRST